MNENLKTCIEKISPLYENLNPPLSRKSFTIAHVNEIASFFPDKRSLPDSFVLQSELEIFSDFCVNAKTMQDVFLKSEDLKTSLKLVNSVFRIAKTAPFPLLRMKERLAF